MFDRKYSKEFQHSLLLDDPEQPASDFNKSLKKALDYNPKDN